MNLKKIKLAGFKSFVDPTVIPFKDKRTAIVGPNGCGKSNVIDAVRWVMGESSAKQLRGELMADVIFNGTTNRKPVGQASIELFFDNNDTMLTGEYAKYSEIAIRREINRDGMSNYYLNGTHCRRKDIVDIFLGTGLGPRSYAIIEQGMITQLIEAKPEELRVYFEEAAGISKYKERRRETENRIRHTRDNLDRLNDIREELDQQLRHLKRQANAANRYKKFKEEQRLIKAQLQALHWRTVNDQVVEQEIKLKEWEVDLEAKQAEISKVATGIEKLREQQTERNDIFNEVQKRYYSFGAEVGRLEQQIQHSKERSSQLHTDLTEINTAWHEAEQNIANDKQNFDKLNAEQQDLQPQTAIAKEQQNKAELELTSAEQTLHEWQIAWDSFNDKAAQSVKQVEVEQTRIAHLEQRIDNETKQIEKFSEELSALPDINNLNAEISDLKIECERIKQHNINLKNDLQAISEKIASEQQQINQFFAELNQVRLELQELNGKRVSLEVLQEVALGKTNESVNAWLEQHQLQNQPRLAQDLQVESGWEKAVETVLSNHLQAIYIEDITTISNTLTNLKQGNLTIFDVNTTASITIQNNTLAAKVKSSWPIAEMLSHIYIAETFGEALNLRQALKAYESIITQDGIWLGSNWISVNFATDTEQGVLQRKRELQELEVQIQNAQDIITNKEELLQYAKTNLTNLEQEREQQQQQLHSAIANYSDNYGKLNVKQTRLEYIQQRSIFLKQEITEHQQRQVSLQEQLKTVQDIWRQAEQDKLSDDEKRSTLLSRREAYQNNLQIIREQVKQAKQATDELVMRGEFACNQLQFLQQSLQRAERQLVKLQERKANITQTITATESPLDALNQELEQALEKRLAVENELITAKQNLENIEHALHEAETQHSALQNEEQEMRNQTEQVRMEWKALQVRCETYEEQIAESEHQLEPLLQEIPETAELPEWEEKSEYIAKRIERLGPINLAAINEYEQKQERKTYLDAQNDDLVEALATLENAIHKIDRETRSRFRQTFETVNNKFTELFPVIFGGGKACLELTSDDLLSTGVDIIAQPPGKRNTTIHLLSGGEKALTAVALVFAIFQLNPAPFCMLDEVDAPLDDNNIIRFCNLVKEMSQQIQFIIVTHNKTTMETAEQLTGVTMHEPGVSRIVSVDIQEAVKMAQK